MTLEQESVVAIVAIVGSVATTWLGLRGQRGTLHDDRLWAKRTETYEAYYAYATRLSRERHQQMTAPTGLIEPDRTEDDEDWPILDRVMIYASDPVREAIQLADEADRVWRRVCAEWQSSDDDADEERLRNLASRAGDVADLAMEKALETIRREMLTGRPRRLRLRRRVAREILAPSQTPLRQSE